MDDLLSAIRKLQDLYDDPDIVTTADQINRPKPKQEVKNIELVNEFVKRNPRADGGRIGFSEGTDIENLSKVHEELRGKYPGVQIRFNKVIGRKGRPSLSINTESSYKPLLKDLKKVYYADELEDFKKQVTKAAEILKPVMKKSAEAKKKRTSKLGLYEREGAYGDRKTVVKQVNQIIEDIASSKRPITDVSKLVQGKLIDSPIKKTSNFVTIDSRTGKPLYLTEKNLKLYKEKIFPKLSSIKSRLGAKAVAPDVLEGLKNLTVDNFDAFYEKNPPFKMKIDMPKNIGEKIISTLERHSTLGGEKFKLISGETFKNFKIKDLNTNEILTADKVNELVEKGDPRFKEFKKVQDQVNKLKKTEYINPVTKQKTTLFKALQQATGDLFPIHIDHIKGVRSEPLKFLNPLLSKTNIGKDTAQTVDELKKIGARSVLPGKTYAQGAVVPFDKKINDLIKFANRKILQTEASGFEKPKTVKKILSQGDNTQTTDKPKQGFKNKISNFASNVKSKMDTIKPFTSRIPGGAAVMAPFDLSMSLLSGAPIYDAAASAGSYFLKDPLLGKAVNIPLSLRAATNYGNEKEMLNRATKRRKGIESAIKNVPERFKNFIDQNKNNDRTIDPFMAAGGGIAKEAGDSSGPPPESGPNPQGLLSLMKRARNY